MQSYFTFSSVITLLACMLCGVAYAWILYKGNQNLPVRAKQLLAAGRAIVVTIICWLLFSPLIKTVSYTLEKPVVVIAHDNSLSVSHVKGQGFNEKAYQDDLKTLEDQLSERYEVRTFSFSDTVKPGLDFVNKGKLSNAMAFAERMTDELQNRNVGAVIMASDGIFNRGGNPAYELNKLKAPVYTVALGDTISKRDVLIANLNYNDLVYLDNDFTIEVQVQAFQSKGEKTKLTVSESGKTVFQQELDVDNGIYAKDIPVKLTASSPGIKRYTVTVTGVKNEITTRNNVQTFFIEVVDGKQDVLIAANSAHPDIAALRRSIELNKHYKVTVALAEDLATVDVNKFGSVILYQLPAQQNLATAFFQKLQSTKASLWFIVGAQSNLFGFNNQQKGVQMSSTGTMQEVFPVMDKQFSLFYLSGDPEKKIPGFDPVLTPFGKLEVKGRASSLLTQRIGKLETGSPLLFYMEENGKKVSYLLGEGLWRWNLSAGQSEDEFTLVDEVVAKTIQYLSVKDDKRKFRVSPSKHTFEENENVILNANLYNDSYAPVNTPDVNVKITNEQGKVFNFTFSKTETAYRLDAGALPRGNYNFDATVNFGGKLLTAKGSFYVNEILAEYQQTTANHQLLNTIAKQSNGKTYFPQQIKDILADLEKADNMKTISYEDKRFEALISMKWLFALIVILLAAEWFFRKRLGEV